MPKMTGAHSASTACIILARGGSKGVVKKNLQPINGVSLIGRAVRAAAEADAVNAVYVSTDDKEIAAEAARFGSHVIDRPEELANDTASSEAGWLHAVPIIQEDLPDLDKLVFLQCTSPFITGDDIDGCLDIMLSSKADCALSVTENHSFLWRVDDKGLGRGINHDERQQRKRRQDLPVQFTESGAIYCVSLSAFLKKQQRFCGSVALYPVNHPPIEIDSSQDLALCSLIASSVEFSQIPAYRLKQVKAIVMDFDGVHTDNSVITDQNGVESVQTSRGDGMGIAALRDSGRFNMLILSKERNAVVLKRAEKLGLPVMNCVDDKVAALNGWLSKNDLEWSQLLYVGNDINDYAAMKNAGLSACPSDSHSSILAIADWILPMPGGRGALRAMSDVLIAQAGT